MRTSEERIAALHVKARQLSEKRALKMYGCLSALLFLLLLQVFSRISISFQTIPTDGFTGTSLFGENAGAYVLVAVISFVLAVCITVYCLKRRTDRS
ncbi:MAG: hypothetical protein IJI44_04060 [Erysipelotrichaceae bacterium]|nr:hypothetical protein [Erysipelotrichaceae bacterium]